jgi:alkyl hydroperoxide reductase subunit AhpC
MGAAVGSDGLTPSDTEEDFMAVLQLGDEAPDFTADTTQGTIDFYDYLGDGWGVLFSHPRDYTPVCTTELGAVAKLKKQFDKRNVKVAAVSVDPLESHKGWTADIEDTQGVKLNYPIIADPDRKVADLYNMIHPNASDTVTVRSVFVIGPDKKVKATITYPQSAGRNFDEILRLIDSLQLSAKYSVSTPANWQQGQDVIIMPAVTDEEAKKKFPKGFRAERPYLRYTPQPPQ